MNKITVARFVCPGIESPILIGDVPYEFGLFVCADVDDGTASSNLGGKSRVSQSGEFLDSLFNRFCDFNRVNELDCEPWERTEASHLRELLNTSRGLSVIGLYDSVATLNPIALDGRLHVVHWGRNTGISVNPIHEILLSGTLFLMVRKDPILLVV